MTAASAAVDELDAELARLADTGHYTKEDLTLALKGAATKAATKLANLGDNLSAPRMTRLQEELDALPAPDACGISP